MSLKGRRNRRQRLQEAKAKKPEPIAATAPAGQSVVSVEATNTEGAQPSTPEISSPLAAGLIKGLKAARRLWSR